MITVPAAAALTTPCRTEHHLARRRVIGDDRHDEFGAARCARRRIGDLGALLGVGLRLRPVAIEDAQLVTGRLQVQRHARSHRAQANECHRAHRSDSLIGRPYSYTAMRAASETGALT
jgi:hypothetical protein